MTLIEQLEATISEQADVIANLERTLVGERHHSAYDMGETKAKHRRLLRETLSPLLEDAIDALEIEPPALKTALSRVKRLLSEVKEAKI